METSGPDVSDGALATVSRRQASSYSTDISRTEYGVWEEGRSLHPICKDRSFQEARPHITQWASSPKDKLASLLTHIHSGFPPIPPRIGTSSSLMPDLNTVVLLS